MVTFQSLEPQRELTLERSAALLATLPPLVNSQYERTRKMARSRESELLCCGIYLLYVAVHNGRWPRSAGRDGVRRPLIKMSVLEISRARPTGRLILIAPFKLSRAAASRRRGQLFRGGGYGASLHWQR